MHVSEIETDRILTRQFMIEDPVAFDQPEELMTCSGLPALGSWYSEKTPSWICFERKLMRVMSGDRILAICLYRERTDDGRTPAESC